MVELSEEEIATERKKFEALIQYRQFLERFKCGTYKLEWVEGRWCGWLMHIRHTREEQQ